MSRRDLERRKFRQALVPGLIVSVAVHAVVLGLGAFGVPGAEARDRADRERPDRWDESSIRMVAVRAAPSRARDGGAGEPDPAAGSPSEAVARATVDAPPARAPSPAPTLAAEPVAVPVVAVPLRTERRERRLTATELAGMFPDGAQMPRAASRAARAVSGEHRDVGDRFRALGGTRRAGPRGEGCTVGPGAIIDRRFPRGITIGGG